MNSITAVPGVRVGHATDVEARTGCTVLLGPFTAAVFVPGMATGTRELEALSHLHLASRADAILLTGGSAFGLDSASGVMAWLEERGAGFVTPVARVPIVPAAVLFDLGVGRPDRRPDAAMGRSACDAASSDDTLEGAVGAGAGATVGKVFGPQHADPGGVGSWAAAGPGCTVGALAVVNALGDVLGPAGEIIAGARDGAGRFLDSDRAIREGRVRPPMSGLAGTGSVPGANTTLAVVATDAPLSRSALEGLARMAATALARRIRPVFSPFDGDVVFAVSTAPAPSDTTPGLLLTLGAIAAHALEQAIERAVRRQ